MMSLTGSSTRCFKQKNFHISTSASPLLTTFARSKSTTSATKTTTKPRSLTIPSTPSTSLLSSTSHFRDNGENLSLEIEEYWDGIIQAAKANEAKQRSELAPKHLLEQDAFRSQWSDEFIISQFMKPSAQLTQLRKHQNLMALAHNFSEAKNHKLKGDQLQKKDGRGHYQSGVPQARRKAEARGAAPRGELEAADSYSRKLEGLRARGE